MENIQVKRNIMSNPTLDKFFLDFWCLKEEEIWSPPSPRRQRTATEDYQDIEPQSSYKSKAKKDVAQKKRSPKPSRAEHDDKQTKLQSVVHFLFYVPGKSRRNLQENVF